MTLTERAVLDLLWARLRTPTNGSSPRYIMAEHVRYDPTYGGRILDAVSVDTWGSGWYAVEGYEVKTTRSDWLRELRDPDKAATWAQHCSRFYLVAPPHVARAEELPPGWGLIIANAGATRCRVKATANPAPVPLEPRQVASIMRATQQTAEHHLRRELPRDRPHH